MSIPGDDIEVPPSVRRLAGGALLTAVWRNAIGGVTFCSDDGRYIKYGPRNAETTMAGEVARLAWAGAYTPVPQVLVHGADDRHEWMVTRAIPARSAVDPHGLADPATAAAAVGAGLRALHDALPVRDCPFDWSVPARVRAAKRRGIRLPPQLAAAPPVDRLVVCHGDACCPNTLLDHDGRFSAHVDLGALGVADRWADIAVAAMSTEWNYGPGWERPLLAAYGVAPDLVRMAFYRELWNATRPRPPPNGIGVAYGRHSSREATVCDPDPGIARSEISSRRRRPSPSTW